MNANRYRALGTLLAVVLIATTSTAVTADELPTAEEIAEAESAAEEAGDEEAEPSDEAEETQPAEESDEAADGDQDTASQDESGDEFETTLRDPIPANLSREGSLGFHGITSAVSPGAMLFQVGMLAEATGGSDFIRHNDSHRMLAANVLVNASFHENVAGHFGLQARNSLNTFGQPQAMLSQGDMTFGLTGREAISPGVWLGGDLSLYVPAGFDSVGMSMGSTSIRPQLLASFDVDEMMGVQPNSYIPLIAHLNLGFRIDNSENLVPEGMELNRLERYAYGVSAYNMFELGAGMEFPLPHVTPFLGWNLGIPVGGDDELCGAGRALRCVSEVGAASYPQKMSVGAKAEPVRDLGLHVGFDMGLTGAQAEGLPATLPYNFHFGLSWQIDPAGRQVEMQETEVEVEVEVEPPRGVLFGQVADRESGEPVRGARIRYVDRSFSSQLSDDNTGVFESYGFEPGEEVALEFSHAAYETEQVTWIVEEGTEEREFTLEPLPREAIVRGEVLRVVPEAEDTTAETEDGDDVDEPREQPLAGARIVIAGEDGTIYETEADDQGRFEQEMTAGATSVAAVADGHLTVGQFLETEPDSTSNVALTLRPFDGDWLAELGGQQIGLNESVHFDGGTAQLLDRSDSLLDHVAALILANPDVGRIQIQGHTDDAGEQEELLILSQEQADSVRDALVDRGVNPTRLETEGYGQSRALVPNTSSRNRSLNRRIEFHLID